MGAVLSTDNVRQGRVAGLRHFPILHTQVREALEEEEGVLGAIDIGSTGRGDFNIRSDMDVVIVYEPEKEDDVMACTNVLASIARGLYVPFNAYTCSRTLAASEMHFFGPLFREHMGWLKKRCRIKGDVGKYFSQYLSRDEEFSWYVRRKIFSLQNAQAVFDGLSTDEQMRFYQKILEAPTHVVRKALVRRHLLGRDDSKKAVLAQYQRLAPEGLISEFERFIELDRRYTDELERQLVKFDARRYEDMLDEIHREAPRVINFVERHGTLELS